MIENEPGSGQAIVRCTIATARLVQYLSNQDFSILPGSDEIRSVEALPKTSVSFAQL